jgi:large-conductance mechanosensitive channel
VRNGLHHRKEDESDVPAPPPEDIVLLREIRDALKNR